MNETEIQPAPVPTRSAVLPSVPVSRQRRRRRWPWMLLGLLVIAAGIYYYRSTHAANGSPQAKVAEGTRAGGGRRRFGMQPPSVSTVVAEKGNLPIFVTALGSVNPLATVTVRSRVTGELQKIHFTEGQLVHAGDLLAEIDPRAYEATLMQAEGQLQRDRAQLDNARRDLERYQNAEAAVTQQQIDSAKATVAQYEGVVRADQGAVDNDRLQLSYCRITAPITGRAGLKLVDQGNLIPTSDTTGLVVLTQEQPISVLFSLPEDNLPQIRTALAQGKTLEVIAYDRAGSTKLATGQLTAVDNQIDTTTGTVKLRALFTNDDRALFPNQFVNVRLVLGELSGVTLLPNSAIQIGAQTNSVFVLKPDSTVEQRTVKLGHSEDDRTAILSGVEPGETVAADGLDKLQDGGKVVAAPRGEAANSNAKPETPPRDGAAKGQHGRRKHNGDTDAKAGEGARAPTKS